ncbi:MAG: hypothetical protein HC810_02875 [Acaryochloridaceae cyanobacterium RL_2_7]|nr:hypothetical protein [Acaryochloridaceae cyanobacterium RL_2_7]
MDQTPDQVTVYFANGESRTGDLLVAADGIYSKARSLYWPDSSPRYQGYVGWRGQVKHPLDNWDEGMAMQYWGQGKRFGLLRMSAERMYWFAALNSLNPEADMNLIRKKDYLVNLFRPWHSSVRDALSRTDENDILVRPIEAVPALTSFIKDRVVLLGDAAHAMTPNLGQGACMAIEDAAVLTRCLQKSESVSVALKTYQRQRAPRVNQVRGRSQLLGQIGQWDNPLMVTLRTLGLSLAPNLITQQSFKSLFKAV